MNNDINFTSVDTLGSLLAQIADLTKQADAIKDSIKESASNGGAKVVEGAIFKATYSDSNVTTFDKDKFIKEHGADVYAKYTKTSARFTVKVTSR
jgi:helix-turn-helix protein